MCHGECILTIFNSKASRQNKQYYQFLTLLLVLNIIVPFENLDYPCFINKYKLKFTSNAFTIKRIQNGKRNTVSNDINLEKTHECLLKFNFDWVNYS